MQKIGKLTLLVLVMLGMVACGARFNPETRMYTVYGVSKFMLPQGYDQIGGLNVNVKPKTWESGAFPYQSFGTTVFADGESYILSQTMVVTGNRYFVRPLQGSKVAIWGSGWRKNTYQLDPGNTTLEYRRYFDYIKSTGHILAAGYKVEVYDRLIGRHVVTRVMLLTPDSTSGYPPMPTAKDLYTLDRDDFRSR